MKTMTCKQLGGGCDMKFTANTFEEIAEQSKQHGWEMYERGDADHMEAMYHMKIKMQSTAAMKEWMDKKRQEFDALPDA